MARLNIIIGLVGLAGLAAGGIMVNLWLLPPWWAWASLIAGGAAGLYFVLAERRSIAGLLGSRRGRRGAGVGLMVVLVLAIFTFIELISYRHHFRFDLTEGKFHSLAPQTVSQLKGLKKEVEALAFFQEGDKLRRPAEALLKAYAYESRLFSYRFLDPDTNPAQAKRFGIKSDAVIVLTSGGRHQQVAVMDEESLTNALINLTREASKKVFFVTGHGEHSITEAGRTSMAQAAEELRAQGYDVAPINLVQTDALEPGSVIVIAGPESDFAPQEVEFLSRYAAQGGRLLVMLNPGADAGLSAFLAGFGVAPQETVIIDRLARRMGAALTMAVVTNYPPHAITRGFEMMSLFPNARSLKLEKEWPRNLAVAPLALTGPSAWGETDIARLFKGEAELTEDDVKGPLPVAVVVEAVEEPDGGSEEKNRPQQPASPAGRGFRMVVFGDSEFASNAHINVAGNRNLFLNTVAWLAEDEELISLRPSRSRFKPAVLSVTAGRLVFWLPVVVVPGIVLLIGLVAVIRRRRRA